VECRRVQCYYSLSVHVAIAGALVAMICINVQCFAAANERGQRSAPVRSYAYGRHGQS
jgi:hypothetical protein